MAKELSMVERTPKGKQARRYFIECERQAMAAPAVPALDGPAALCGLLLGYTEKVIALEAKVQEAKPKVKFFDEFMNADGLYTFQNAGRALGCHPNLFCAWLRESGFLFRQDGAMVPYVRHRAQGLFEVKNKLCNSDGKARPQTYITPKGIEYFAPRTPPEIRVGSKAA